MPGEGSVQFQSSFNRQPLERLELLDQIGSLRPRGNAGLGADLVDVSFDSYLEVEERKEV
jgi:hypothetical protein